MNKRATYGEVLPVVAEKKRILVWDLPTRVFHWSLVLAVTVAVVSGEIGGDWMEVHGKAGLAILGLVAFRLAWGFAGSTHARFLSFLPTAAKLRAYLRGRWKGQGHNPLGALSIFALLGLLGTQAVTGLFGNDEISFTGLHKQLAYALLVVLAVHIVAILVYLLIKKDNLVKPMVTGWKEVRLGTSAAKGSWPALLLSIAFAVVVVAFASGAVRW